VFIAAAERLTELRERVTSGEAGIDLHLEPVIPGGQLPSPADIDVVLLYLSAEEDLNLVTQMVDAYPNAVHKWLICKRRRYYMHIALQKDFNLRIDMDYEKLIGIIQAKEKALGAFLGKVLKHVDPEEGKTLRYETLDQTLISQAQFVEATTNLEDSSTGLTVKGLRQWVREGVSAGPLTTALRALIKKHSLLRGFSLDIKKFFDPEIRKKRSAYETDVTISCGNQSFEPELSFNLELVKGSRELLTRISDIGVLLPHEQESFGALSLKIRPGVSNEMVQDYFNNLLLKLQLLPHVLPPRYRDELAKVSMVYNFKSKISSGRAYVFLLFDFFVLLSQTSRRELKELESFLTVLASEATEGKVTGSLGFKTGLAGMLNEPRKDLFVHLLEAFKLTFTAKTSASLKTMIVELLQNLSRHNAFPYLALLPIAQNINLNFANFRELPDELMRKVLDQIKPKGAQTMAGIWRVIAMKIYRKRNMYSVLKVTLYIVPLRDPEFSLRPV
jgi:hypothetical protein